MLAKLIGIILLNNVKFPQDLKKIKTLDLPVLCEELRSLLISTITKIGGHLGGALGVVELTAALHYVFDTPRDKIIWDIGHQSHVHKILTGRKDQIGTVKQPGGLSGFCSIFESEYDSFGAGHSSTSISAGLGFLIGNNLQKNNNDWVISVIGDGSMGAGMVFEALNNVPDKGKMLIILNDNNMSIDPSVGNLTRHFDNISENNIFSNFGLDYIGVKDGHDVVELVSILEFIKK